jgi:para-aminobenzoate synthetase component 1
VIVRSAPAAISLDAALEAVARRPLPCALKAVGVAPEPCLLLACAPVRRTRTDSVDELDAAWSEERARWHDPERPGVPVAAGFLSYDLGRRFECIRGRALPGAGWPLVEFRFYDAWWVLGGWTGRSEIWACDERAARRLAGDLWSPVTAEAADTPAAARGPLAELEPPRGHLAAVARALEYIRAGDIYQVNLARRLGCGFPTRPGTAPAASLFLRLEREAPAPHAFWMADGAEGTALVGNSPERFLRQTSDGVVETSPIKGTRPRDGTAPERGAALLAASAKDRAEHVMIVDLERNDLGRVCRVGSVEVAELCRMLTLPTVHHLESTVRGRLRSEVGLGALLRATFPGGSITGAPKIRAMEIIEELEPARRGPYTGATGWLGAAGDLDLAVAIRTALVRDGRLVLWVGGGIVADSSPEAELAETWDKARAFSRVLA